jgi:hypothetical protein
VPFKIEIAEKTPNKAFIGRIHVKGLISSKSPPSPCFDTLVYTASGTLSITTIFKFEVINDVKYY